MSQKAIVPSEIVQEAVREGQKIIETFDRRLGKRFRELARLHPENGDMCDPFPNGGRFDDEETTGQIDVPTVLRRA